MFGSSRVNPEGPVEATTGPRHFRVVKFNFDRLKTNDDFFNGYWLDAPTFQVMGKIRVQLAKFYVNKNFDQLNVRGFKFWQCNKKHKFDFYESSSELSNF